MRIKKKVALLILLILPFAIFAGELEEAFDTVYNGIYASVASYFSVPKISLDGISFEMDSNSHITKIAFNRVDMAKVNQGLKKDIAKSSWYERLLVVASKSLSPIIQLATSQIEKSGYQVGDAILDGSIDLEYKNYYPFGSLLDLFVKNDWSNLEFSFSISMIVTGKRFTTPMLLEGNFDVNGGINQKVIVKCKNLEINHTKYEVTPVIFSN